MVLAGLRNSFKKIREQKKTMYFFCFVTFVEILITILIFIPSRTSTYYTADSDAPLRAIPLIRIPEPKIKLNGRDVTQSQIFMMLEKGRCSLLNSLNNISNINVANTLVYQQSITIEKNTAKAPDLSKFNSCMARETSLEDAIDADGSLTDADGSCPTCQGDKPICYRHEFCYMQSNGTANICLSGIYNDYCVRSGSNGSGGDLLFYDLVLSFCVISLFSNIMFLIILIVFLTETLNDFKNSVKTCGERAKDCTKRCRKKQDPKKETTKKTFKLGKRTKCCAQFWFMLFFVLLDLSIVGLSSMSYHILVRPPISGDIFNIGVNGVKLEANSYDANQKFDSIHPTISPILTEFLVPAMLLLAAVFGSMILLYRVVFVYSVIYPDTIEIKHKSDKKKIENVETDDDVDDEPYDDEYLINNQDIKLRF